MNSLEVAFCDGHSDHGERLETRLATAVSTSLQHAYAKGFPLHTLAEGLTRDLCKAHGSLRHYGVRGVSRTFEDVVAALSPPAESTILPAKPEERPTHIGPIEYVRADVPESSAQDEAADDEAEGIPVKHYTRLMRDLVSQPTSVRPSGKSTTTGEQGIAYILSHDFPRPFGLSEAKQSLLRALKDAETPTDFVIALASHGKSCSTLRSDVLTTVGNEDHAKAMTRWLVAPDGVKSFDEFLNETLMAEMANAGAVMFIPAMDAVPSIAAMPGLESPIGSVSTLDSEDEGSDPPDSGGDSEEESDYGDDVAGETHWALNEYGTAFWENTSLRHHMVAHPAGRVGARDASYLEQIPCSIRDLSKILDDLAVLWDRSQSGLLSYQTTDMNEAETKKYSDDRVAAMESGQDAWAEIMGEVGKARHRALSSVDALLRAANAPGTELEKFTTVMPSVHDQDSDRHETVASYLSGVAAKLLNGWRVAKKVRLNKIGGTSGTMRTSHGDEGVTKRTRSESPGEPVQEEHDAKRSRV